jgi:hypothetical protein
MFEPVRQMEAAMDDAGNGNGNSAAREERLQIMLNPNELEALDNFRFKIRMPSRAAAVRELLKRGLAAEGFVNAPHGAKSTDYGVIAASKAQETPKRR